VYLSFVHTLLRESACTLMHDFEGSQALGRRKRIGTHLDLSELRALRVRAVGPVDLGEQPRLVAQLPPGLHLRRSSVRRGDDAVQPDAGRNKVHGYMFTEGKGTGRVF
jgi:hypothetical protein